MLNLSNDTISAKPGLQESQQKLVEVMSALQSFLIRHFGKESGTSYLSQWLLGLLLRTGKNLWPIADQRVLSYNPRNNCGINFGSSPLKALLNEETNAELRYVELKTWRSDIPIVSPFAWLLSLCGRNITVLVFSRSAIYQLLKEKGNDNYHFGLTKR